MVYKWIIIGSSEDCDPESVLGNPLLELSLPSSRTPCRVRPINMLNGHR